MSNNFIKDEQNLQIIEHYDSDEIDMGELIATVLDGKWLIIFFTFIALTAGIAKALLSTPIYTADALLQVEEASSSLAALDTVAGLLESTVPVTAEIEIIQSRLVLGKAVTNLNTNIIVQPKYFPVIGKAVSRNFSVHNKNKVSSPLFNYSDYAWGGEEIKVDTLTMPESWIGGHLTLISGEKGKYKILKNGQFIVGGEVGKSINKIIEGEKTAFKIFVSLLKSRVGTYFIVTRQSQASAIGKLKQNFSIAEKGKGSGILNLTFESASPYFAMQTLNEIANIYVRLNVEQKSAEAQQTLEFLGKQLPLIKDQLEAATTVLNEYRLQKGSVDLNIETQSILGGVVKIGTNITSFQQKRDELRQSFTTSHPSIIAIDKQIWRLQNQLNALNKKVVSLPKTQRIILQLTRDVQVNNVLYTSLLNTMQTLKVAKAGTVGNVRIIDYALLPSSPIKPKKTLIIIIAIIIGFIIGLALVFLRKVFYHGIENPDIIEQRLKIAVYASIPHSEAQVKLFNQQKKNKKPTRSPALLAIENNEDLAIESLRSLRTTLHFAFLEAKNNIIMICGPSPSVGKTFVSENLAIVLANAGKKVLLIDADLRKGFIHKTLGTSRENGLSELISNKITPSDAIQNVANGMIDFIPTGVIPPNPSELLLNKNFKIKIEELSLKYDQVIIDTPPVLAVTDACIIGRIASASLLVVRAGKHPLKELEQTISRLKQNDVDIKGVIFNDVLTISSRYGYGKYVYQYQYQK